METWSDVVSSYPEGPEPKDYAKAIRSAEIILSEELAPFETEWLVQTLLFKPVCLFETISSERSNEAWLKTKADSFKLLAKIVEKRWDVVENYYSDIIKLCMLPFDPQTRKDALLCLNSVAKQPSADLSEQVVSRHVSALEMAKDCKAPRALLVGTICRYHPELVQEHFTRIWRIYLNMLQPNNKTDQVVYSVLQGINGLFEHFGDDIEMEQINRFYDTMSREYIKISKCLEVLLSIFKHHARLFKERLAKDRAVRLYLWQIDTNTAMDALSNIYEVILPEVKSKEDVIKFEVLPRLNSPSILIKHTALRIIIQAGLNQSMEVPTVCSGIELEFQLRAKKLSYEEANTVSWCIGSSVSNSETMLLTAIMFYDNLPTLKKKDIVVNGILKASDDVRKAALILLLKLCLQDNLDKYIDIWRALLDNTTGSDLSKAVLIFEDALHHILEVLASVAGDSEKAYEEVKPILSLMATLLSLHKTEFNTEAWCQSFIPTLTHLAKLFSVNTVKMISESDENEVVYVEKFEEDTVLSKLVSTLITIPDVSQNTLSAFQILFSSDDTDYKVMSKALFKLEVMIESENNHLDKRLLSLIINQIFKLKSKNVTESKDARVFQKDATMFLGKYGHMTQDESFSDDIYVLKLKNKVTLNIPNIVEGTTFKIDLQRVLQLCLLRGDKEALYSLLVILSAGLCDRSDSGLQEATVRVIHALFRTNIGKSEAEVAVYPALLMCNTAACVQTIMKGITEELTPVVRRRLSDSLQVLLTHEPGSELTGELLKVVGEHTAFLISRDTSSTVVPGLDILRAFLSAITDNNSLIIEHLPNIQTYTSNIQEDASETFEQSSNLFIEKLDLFTDTQIKETVQKILEKYATNIVINESNLDKIMGFIKRVMDVRKYDAVFLIDMTLEMCQKLTILSPQFLNLVTLLAYLNTSLDLNSEIHRQVVVFNNCLVLEQLLGIQFDEGDDKINAALVFLKEYAEELVEVDAEKTLQCLGNIIENIPPNSVLSLKKNLTACLSIYKSIQNYLPTIQASYEKWYKKLDLQNITERIEEKILFTEFSDNISDIIYALKIMSELVDIPTTVAKEWTKLSLGNLTEVELKWGRLFLTDLLSISEKCLSKYDFEEILETHLDFVKSYVNVYLKRLISKPFVLKGDKSGLLVDIVECYGKMYNEDYFQSVLDLVEHLWPPFLQTSSFDDKLSVLLNLLRLPKSVGLGCPAVDWATTLLTSEGTSQDDRIKLIGALPAGEEYSTYYRTFASGLPVRLSEMQGRYIPPFRALLDTLATNGDMTLLDIVLTLAAGDDTKGWWDHAIDACMTALAAKEDIDVLDKAYRRAKTGVNLGICNRIFLPLLRHSSRKFCDRYISTIVTDLFNILRVGFKEPANNETYRKRIVSYAIAFNILKVAFDKISTEGLENGVINEKAGSQKPWYFLEQTCKYCVTISANVKCPSEANDELKNTCLWLQSSSYNCLSTAICRRKLSKNLSARIFNVHAWTAIVDKDAEYLFELQSHARYRGSKPAKRSVDALATSSSFTGTVRSRLFLTTLSENPLQFDMIPEDEDDEEEEDDSTLEFEDSVLNAHGCLSTLTSLLEHASTVEHTEWRDTTVVALTTAININAKWLVAQAICNAVEELKPHGSALCPALLQLIADTPTTLDGKPVLNNLHIEIISTITKWNLTELPHDPNMNTTVEYLINTCIAFKQHYGINRRLLNTLNGLLQLYGNMVTVKWNVFQDYCVDLHPFLPIFERLLKNGVALPELLAAIFANQDAKHWSGNSKLAEVCGLAFSLADSGMRQGFLTKFWHVLNAVRSFNVNGYVKMLFYAQKNCKQCCDFNQLKIITDLAPKVEKSKCLSIIASYLENSTEFDDYFTDMFQIISLSELFDSKERVEAMKIARSCLKLMDGDTRSEILKGIEQNCRSSEVQVRKEAFSVFLTAFQGLFKRESHNPFKRKALDSSPILDTIRTQNEYEKLVLKKIFDGMFDYDEVVSNMVSDGVEECLSKDMNMRFAELFYIIIYQCSLAVNNNYELSNCGSKLLELLFSDLRSQDAFKVIMLRDEGLPQSILRAYESISVRTKTMARTVLRSGVTYRQRISRAPARREIDVQKPITDILDVFLQLSKTNSQVCQELCVQMMKCLQGTGRRFDLNSVMAKQLFDIIRREPFCLTPLVLDACRVFVKDISSIQGFNDSVKELKQAVSNSEGYLYTNILFEDLQLRSGDRSQFIFSMVKEDSDAAMRDEEFTLQGLIDAFGSLSNWDDLRVQDKKQIEERLPPLWTKNEDFTISLREYFDGANKKLDYSNWFNKMVASYYPEEVTQNRISWLKLTEKWPKRDFVTSAVIEAIQWHQNEAKLFGDISSSDCLTEWAARLMIRSAYYNQQQCAMDSDNQDSISFTHDELSWCKAANERKLPTIALQCIDRNKESLLDVEILPWVQEKVKAYRTIGLKENNGGSLQKALEAAESVKAYRTIGLKENNGGSLQNALEAAEKQAIRFASQSSFETNISMQQLILQLHHDLGSISKTKLDDTMQIVSTQIIRQKGRMISSNNAQVLKSIYETAMLYYDELWIEDDKSTQNAIIQGMTEIIDKALDHNLATDCNLLISVLLNRLSCSGTVISDDTAKKLLEQINRILPRLDFFSIAILKGLPAGVLNSTYWDKLRATDLDVCREYFQLICDANYALLQYCDELRRNILDETEWNTIFNRMKTKLFETQHGGTDYQALNTIKNKLYALEDMTEIDPKAKELKQIIEELRSKPHRTTLRLSQLCPDLCSAAILERKRGHLQRLLRLPPNVYVVKFAEQISVFTDSIRRPCVVKALLSNGETRRFICKSGEAMYHDAAVQRVAAILPAVSEKLQVRSYNVTPLSDDSAIIEYLEDHIRLRDLMEEKQEINVAVSKAGHEKLIIAPSFAMEQFNAVCDKVTPFILRSSIENNCSCVKEFITKKRTFEDTLSSMTILNWLFGVGDRHLQNIMYSVRDGGVCGVDWASVFLYGCQELPPARLTANILAVCDVKILESRLQNILLRLRESQNLIEAFIKTSFYQSGPEFKELNHIKNILQGKSVSYEITRERIEESEKKYKADYVKLLDQVFENFVPKDEYSVEEQVSCLLQHSTEPRILAVTQPGWEAWL